MIDYTKGVNLGSDVITKKIRVSTAKFPSTLYDFVWETWIFSDDERQKSRQLWHKTEQEAIKVHNYIVNNLERSLKNE